ncbi:MAG: hypothetical protein AVDCRST_MAG29-247, partial [uncultured Nocardioidaceae bacterium]
WSSNGAVPCVPPSSGMPSRRCSPTAATCRWWTSAVAPEAWPYGWLPSGTPSPSSIPALMPLPHCNVVPTTTVSPSASAAYRATPRTCSTTSTSREPTWCSATAYSRWSTSPTRRWPRSIPPCGRVARSASWSPDGSPAWSLARWPATSSRPPSCSRTFPPVSDPPPSPASVPPPETSGVANSVDTPARRSSPSWSGTRCDRVRCMPSGSSPTWSPVRWSTSSPAPLPPCSPSSEPSPSDPSSERWPRSSTSWPSAA